MDMEFLALRFDPQFVERAHRTVRLALAGTEAGEIMPSDKKRRRRLHGAGVQCAAAMMPDPAMVERRRLAPRQQAV